MPPPSALVGLPISRSGRVTHLSGSGAAENGNRAGPTGESNGPTGDTSNPTGDTTAPNGANNGPTHSSGATPGPSGLTSSGSTASVLTNLLPASTAKGGMIGEGVYVGDGRPPIAPKLAQRIRRWEFVDMGELLPEFSQHDDEAAMKRPWMTKKPRQVTDIFSWMQCFTTYVSVLGPAYPEAIPELMAYAATIVRVSQDFSGLAWQRYDAGFRRQAALTGNRQWSRINATLYTMCFTGKALAITRCELCFASTHTTTECGLQGDTDPELPTRIKAIESAVLALTAGQGKSGGPVRGSGEPCRLWNNNKCTFPRCKHEHVCGKCRGNHQAIVCPNNYRYQGQQNFQGARYPTTQRGNPY